LCKEYISKNYLPKTSEVYNIPENDQIDGYETSLKIGKFLNNILNNFTKDKNQKPSTTLSDAQIQQILSIDCHVFHKRIEELDRKHESEKDYKPLTKDMKIDILCKEYLSKNRLPKFSEVYELPEKENDQMDGYETSCKIGFFLKEILKNFTKDEKKKPRTILSDAQIQQILSIDCHVFHKRIEELDRKHEKDYKPLTKDMKIDILCKEYISKNRLPKTSEVYNIPENDQMDGYETSLKIGNFLNDILNNFTKDKNQKPHTILSDAQIQQILSLNSLVFKNRIEKHNKKRSKL
jgi:hypothetical protein